MNFPIRIAVTIIAVCLLINQPLFSQENKEEPPEMQEAQVTGTSQITPTMAIEETARELEASQPEEMSIYGEVISINEETNSVNLRYYDYDSDEEKAQDVFFDKDTKMQNIQAIKDIKAGDWIDAVYITKDGKDIAKSVIIEKEEDELDSLGTGPEGQPFDTPKT